MLHPHYTSWTWLWEEDPLLYIWCVTPIDYQVAGQVESSRRTFDSGSRQTVSLVEASIQLENKFTFSFCFHYSEFHFIHFIAYILQWLQKSNKHTSQGCSPPGILTPRKWKIGWRRRRKLVSKLKSTKRYNNKTRRRSSTSTYQICKWVLSWDLNLVNVLDSWISFGSAFQRTIDRGTKLDNMDDFLVAGTGYPSWLSERVSRSCWSTRLAWEEVTINTVVQDL